MNGYTSDQVFNGTYGEVWFDGDYMAETESLKAEVDLSYESVSRVRNLADGKKLIGIEGKGEVKLKKVSSYVTKKMSGKLKKGKSPSFTIISKIDDPDAIGAERVALYGCKFDKMILADWERKKVGEESYSFTFEDWELLDTTK
nr:MAG TPA: tail tube protein [Caudoviricetes sp.]